MQVAIVTGASSGIGFGTAVKLAEAGMAVVGTGRDEARLAELAKKIGDPERVVTVAVDLTARHPSVVRLHLQRVPGWSATIDGRPLALRARRCMPCRAGLGCAQPVEAVRRRDAATRR